MHFTATQYLVTILMLFSSASNAYSCQLLSRLVHKEPTPQCGCKVLEIQEIDCDSKLFANLKGSRHCFITIQAHS